MSMWKHYLLMLLFIILAGVYLIYQMISIDMEINYLETIGMYFLYAHGLLLAGFVWMFLVKLMSNAFYKEGFAEFYIGMAMLAVFGIAIYLNLSMPFDTLVDNNMEIFIVAILSVPLGATMGYRVNIE